MEPNEPNLPNDNLNVPPPVEPSVPVSPPVNPFQPQPQPDPFQQPVQSVQPQPVVFQQPVQPQPMPVAPVGQVPPVKQSPLNKKTMMVIGIVAGVILLASVVTAVVLTSSNSSQNKAEDKSDVVKKEEEPVVEKEVAVPTGYQRVGEADFGYANVPDDWVKFGEIGAPSGTMMQYSDTAGFSVVTVTKYPNTYSLDEFTSMLLESLSSGPSVIQTKTTVDGNTANLLSQDYTSTEGKVLDTYVFEENDQLATISIEYKSADASVAKEIISSYRLEK